jgi:hypothetical protein
MLQTFWPMIQAIILGQGRGVLAAAGGWLIAQGYIGSDQSQQWLGASFWALTAILSAIDKFVVNKKIATAATDPTAPVAVKAVAAQAVMKPIPNP